jgi:polar amino acid transport system permease protein
MTVAVTVAAFVLGAIGGVPLLLARQSRRRLVRTPAMFLIDLIRAVPPIAWLFLIYYGLTQEGLKFGSFMAAATGLGLFSSAHMAEIYRSGLLAVGRGQWEAARAVGLSEWRVLADVVAPQALRVVVPPSASYAINLLKDSAVASVIGVSEIAFHANAEAQATFRGLTVFALAALVYIALSIPLAVASRVMDRRLQAVLVR